MPEGTGHGALGGSDFRQGTLEKNAESFENEDARSEKIDKNSDKGARWLRLAPFGSGDVGKKNYEKKAGGAEEKKTP